MIFRLIMYKLSILAIFFTASVALAIEKPCKFVSFQNGRCVFQCRSGSCGRTAESNKNNFLGFLQSNNYDCISENTDSIICSPESFGGECQNMEARCPDNKK